MHNLDYFHKKNSNGAIFKYDKHEIPQVSVAKPNPFFQVEPDFALKIQVESGRVGLQGQKMGPIGSGSLT